MGAQQDRRDSFLGRLWQWTEEKLIQDVPEHIARCEFDCSRIECRWDEWETCEKRLRHIEQAKARAASG